MTVTELNSKQKLQLRADMKKSMVHEVLFSIDVIFVVPISNIMSIFGKRPSECFGTSRLLNSHDK